MRRLASIVLGCVVILGALLFFLLRPSPAPVTLGVSAATPEALELQCRDFIGEARVEEVAEGIFVAIGYDLANTILIRTDEGNVVVDVSQNRPRAEAVKAALQAVAPGPTRAIVFTHSHIDHVGGAEVWAEEGTEIWATEAFAEHFYKQYGTFRPAEGRRAGGQFGWHVAPSALPCSALGHRLDLDAALDSAALLPTRTFRGSHRLELGGRVLQLVEAHGETHDQLFVWLEEERILLPGDNLYHAFPNLYTIRGTSPRPVDAWIRSLDRMRALEPALLLPSHTRPLAGAEEIASTLRDYRDGIQWVRDSVVRGANAGLGVDELVRTIRLPAHLARSGYLTELYGQLDWSVRALYTNQLGWFDERVETLYPLERREEARRTVALMGGAGAVVAEIEGSLEREDPRWALHLLALLRDSGEPLELRRPLWKRALTDTAKTVANTNGRGYLLEEAWRLEHGVARMGQPTVPDALVDALPLALVFEVLQTRLIPELADVEESVTFRFPDVDETWHVTLRRGVAEVVQGAPLPGTPAPLATVTLPSRVYKDLALGRRSPAEVVASGELHLEGERAALLAFLQRFDRES